MKRLLFISFYILIAGIACGQGFNQAVGIRGGLTSGVGYRYYTSDVHSLKALLGNRFKQNSRGLRLHAFSEYYRYDLFDFSYQLVLFYGFGAHAGYETWDVQRFGSNSSWYETKSAFVTGVDVLGGVEYLFYEAPVIAGLEIKPYIDVLGKDGFDVQLFDFAFTIKYLF